MKFVKKFSVWIKAIRPATLVACVSPIVAGTALAFDFGKVRWWTAVVALVSSGLIQIGTNLHNDYADFIKGADTKERVGPKRAAAEGWIQPEEIKKGAQLAMGLAAVTGASLIFAGGWPILLVGLASILAGFAYTGGPFPLAYYGLGDLFVLLFFGFVAVIGTFYLHTGQVTVLSWLIGGAIGLFNTAILVVNNLRDRHTDRKANKRTIAVRFGAKIARAEYVAAMTIPYFLVGAAAFAKNSPSWLLVFLSIPFTIKEIKAILTKDGSNLNPHLGRAALAGLAFSLLFALGTKLAL